MARGVTTSTFGGLFTGELIQSHNLNPEGSSSKGEDSLGDVLCEEVYGEYSPIEETFKFCRGSTFDSTVTLGEVSASYVITRIVLSRSNKDILTAVVTGMPASIVGDTATLPTYTIPWPSGYSAGGAGAIAAGITVSAGRLISSSVTASIENTMSLDSLGDPACMNFYAGRLESTNEIQSCDTQPAATVASGWTLAPGAGSLAETNTDYETGTWAAFRNIIRD